MKPMLEITDVTYSWRGAADRMGPISASIPPGQLVGLIGPNGAGKSTLLKLIAALWQPNQGNIRVAGDDMATLNASARARLVAFVPQTIDTSFDLTVQEVVELGQLNRLSWRDRLGFRKTVSSERLQSIMRQTEVLDLQDRSFTTLSGGEAKRTLLAAALVQGAPLLLLDEPTAHLDPGHALKFLELVRAMVDTGESTVLMAYHDLATVGLYADTLWVMDHGQLVLSGSPDAVLRDPRLCRIYDADLIPLSHPRTHRPMLIYP